MLKNKSLCLTLLLLGAIQLSQAQIQVSGAVQDKTTQAPIEFAHVFFLSQQHIGVITNQEGAFSLSIPENLRNDTLVISQIGYNHYYLPLSTLIKDQNELKIDLAPGQFILAEAVVIAEAGLKTIVRRAIERIPQNYPTEKHRLKAYYREHSITDSVYTHLTEAFVTIQDISYAKEEDADIFIHELRKSNDDREPKVPRHIVNIPSNELSNTYAQRITNILRPRVFKHKKRKSKPFAERTKFRYLGQIIIDSDTLIRIGYNPRLGTFTRASDGVKEFLSYGELVINKTDYAIVKHRYDSKKADIFFETQYRKTNGKYYPSLIISLLTIPVNEGKTSYGHACLYHIYAVESNKKEFLPLRHHKRINKEESIRHMNYVYRPDFWKKNTILLEVPANVALEKDLNRKQSLRDQFEENAKRVKIKN